MMKGHAISQQPVSDAADPNPDGDAGINKLTTIFKTFSNSSRLLKTTFNINIHFMQLKSFQDVTNTML